MPSRSVTRMAVWIVLLAAGVFVLSAAGSYGGIEYVPARIVSQVLAYAILGSWLVVALVRPQWRPTTPLVLPVLLIMGAYALAALLSQRPRLSFEPFTAGLAWAIAFLFLGRLFADPWFRSRIRVVLTVLPLLVAVAYIVEVVVRWIEWWSLVGGFAIPPLRPGWAGLIYASPNIVGTILLLTAPLSAVLLWQQTGRRGPSIVVLGLAVFAIFLTGSRGAWLGVATAGVVAAVIAVAAVRGGQDGMTARLRQVPRPIAITGLLVATIGVVLLAPAVLQRLLAGGTALRLDLWRSALTIFAEHPVTGGGPGTWVQLKVEANPPGVANLILEHAHNTYVQAAAELGVLGLTALGILGVAVVARLIVAMRSGRTASDRGVSRAEAAAVAAALAGFAGQSMVDNLVNLPVICLLVIGIVAWVDGGLEASRVDQSDRDRRDTFTRISRSPLIPIGGLIAMVIALPTLVRIDQAALSAVAGDSAALRGDDVAALAAYDAAIEADGSFTLYQLQRASTLARLGRTAEALEEYRSAVAVDPVGLNLVSLAALELAAGNRDAASAAAGRARELAPGDPQVALNAGAVAEALGELESATDRYSSAIASHPSLAASQFWDGPNRHLAKDDLVAAARARSDPLTAALILAYAGDPAGARAELAQQPSSPTRDTYLAVVDWLDGRVDAARSAIADMAAREPMDWFTAGWASRIFRLSGDPATGARYERWANTVAGDMAFSAIGEATILEGAERDAHAGLPGNYPTSVYIRRVPPYLVPPEVVAIGPR